MTDTEALRRALDAPNYRTVADYNLIEDAARRWLALAEGGEAMVERVVKAMRDTAAWADDEIIEGRFNAIDWWDALARAVLAAITEEGEPGPS